MLLLEKILSHLSNAMCWYWIGHIGQRRVKNCVSLCGFLMSKQAFALQKMTDRGMESVGLPSFSERLVVAKVAPSRKNGGQTTLCSAIPLDLCIILSTRWLVSLFPRINPLHQPNILSIVNLASHNGAQYRQRRSRDI